MNISRRHCSIAFDDGRFVLTDCSTNGVYINRASKATERNSRVPLNQGDVIGLGNYVISVALVDDPAVANICHGATNGGSGRASLDVDPLAEPPRRPPEPSPFPRMVASRRGADPFEMQAIHPTGPIDPEVDHFDGIRPSADWHGLPTPDHAPATSQIVAPPRVMVSRRVDFDALIGHLPGQTPVVPGMVPEPPNAIPPEPGPVDFARSPNVRRPDPAPAGDGGQSPPPVGDVAEPSAAADGQAVRAHRREETDPPTVQDAYVGLAAFLDGAGIPNDRIDGSDPEATLRAAGKIFRAMADGFQQVLKSRAAVKSDLGINQTIIAGTGNNPLKFSVTADEAVRLLLTPRAPGYMDPLDAARQAAGDLQSHELAVMAGMQEALLSLLHRFNPDELEKRLVAGMLGNLLPAARKARYWDAFRQTYNDLSREAEDEFQSVFGRPFARAYNAQARKD